MRIMGIDPGTKGAWVVLDESADIVKYGVMPYEKVDNLGAVKNHLNSTHLMDDFKYIDYIDHTFCEMPTPYGMNGKAAFTYGFSFCALVFSICDMSPVYVKPGEWTKELHQDEPKHYKTKAKSANVFEKLFKGFEFEDVSKAHREGLTDAALIAYYGLTLIKQGDTNGTP